MKALLMDSKGNFRTVPLSTTPKPDEQIVKVTK